MPLVEPVEAVHVFPFEVIQKPANDAIRIGIAGHAQQRVEYVQVHADGRVPLKRKAREVATRQSEPLEHANVDGRTKLVQQKQRDGGVVRVRRRKSTREAYASVLERAAEALLIRGS